MSVKQIAANSALLIAVENGQRWVISAHDRFSEALENIAGELPEGHKLTICHVKTGDLYEVTGVSRKETNQRR